MHRSAVSANNGGKMKRIIFLLIVLVLFAVSCGKSKIVVEHNGSDEAGDIDETTQADEDSDEDADDEEDSESVDEDSPDGEVPDYSETYGLPKCSLQGKTPCFDPMTDLVWSSLSDPMKHEEAVIYCYNLDEGGFKDWYLPDIDELRTLMRHCPDLEPGGECMVSEKRGCLSYTECYNDYCFQTQCMAKEDEIFSRLWDPYELWSASKFLEEEYDFWTLNFEIPRIYYRSDGYTELRARCTRSVHSSGEDEGPQPRTVECTGLPENMQWNTVSSITQTYNGARWEPDSEGVFDEEPSTENCHFKCLDDFVSELFIFKNEDYVKCSPECAQSEAEICVNPNSGIYSDSKTGLMWSSLPEKDDLYDSNNNIGWAFATASYYCENLTQGGYSDWRLPTIEELRTLIRNCPDTETGGACSLDNIPDDLFDENNKVPDECLSCEPEEEQSGKYSRIGDFVPLLSATESPVRINYVIKFYWYVDFSSGMISSVQESANPLYILVRCVREKG